MIERAHCPHPLPVTGWVRWTNTVTGKQHVMVTCGRCHEDVDASEDQDWNRRYFERFGYYPLGDPPQPKPKRGRKTA